jgi:hypothetical protein
MPAAGFKPTIPAGEPPTCVVCGGQNIGGKGIIRELTCELPIHQSCFFRVIHQPRTLRSAHVDSVAKTNDKMSLFHSILPSSLSIPPHVPIYSRFLIVGREGRRLPSSCMSVRRSVCPHVTAWLPVGNISLKFDIGDFLRKYVNENPNLVTINHFYVTKYKYTLFSPVTSNRALLELNCTNLLGKPKRYKDYANAVTVLRYT